MKSVALLLTLAIIVASLRNMEAAGAANQEVSQFSQTADYPTGELEAEETKYRKYNNRGYYYYYPRYQSYNQRRYQPYRNYYNTYGYQQHQRPYYSNYAVTSSPYYSNYAVSGGAEDNSHLHINNDNSHLHQTDTSHLHNADTSPA